MAAYRRAGQQKNQLIKGKAKKKLNALRKRHGKKPVGA
jgi:hypothetical protein